MADENTEREQLIHQLRNVQAERQALKHLLCKATDLIDSLVESDCEESQKQQAKADAARWRRAAS